MIKKIFLSPHTKSLSKEHIAIRIIDIEFFFSKQ